MIIDGKKYLITTDNWFYGLDGFQYRAAYGKCKILTTEDCFNFKPSRPSTNWFVRIGEGDKSIIVAGCQIHFATESSETPTIRAGKYEDKNTEQKHNQIYIAE